jgi:hypothetical protein
LGAHFIREPRPKDRRGRARPEMLIVAIADDARLRRSMWLLVRKQIRLQSAVDRIS